MDPIKVTLSNLDIYSIPPPGSGPLLGYILNVLDSYFTGGADASDDPLTYHRIAEAFKHAYAQRTKFGDPAFVPEVNDVRNLLLSQQLCS